MRIRCCWCVLLFDDGAALLAHELGNVVRSAAAFAARAAPFPAAERLRTGPRARGRARALVGVADAGFDLVEEARDLSLVAGEDASREPILRGIRLGDGLVEALDLSHREEWHEQLLAEQRAGERQPRDRRRDEMPAIEDTAAEALPSGQDGPLGAGLGCRALVALDRARIDDGSEVHV